MTNPPTLSTVSTLFVRIFDDSEAADRFIENVNLVLSKRSNVKLFIISDSQIVNQDSTKFELRINIVMDNLNINNGDHNQRLLNIVKPAINKAYSLYSQTDRAEYHSPPPNLPTAVNQKQTESVQSYSPNQKNNYFIEKFERAIKDPSFPTLFPFIAFCAIVIAVIAGVVIGVGEPSKDPSENPPLQNPPENRDSNSPSISPSISPSLSPSTPNNKSRQNTG